jgi:hypothetical protein
LSSINSTTTASGPRKEASVLSMFSTSSPPQTRDLGDLEVGPVAHEHATAGLSPTIHNSKLGARRESLEREFRAKEEGRKLIDLPEFGRQSRKDNPSVVTGGVILPEQRARVKTAGRLYRILAATLRSRQEAHTQNCVELREYLFKAAHG